MLRLYSGFSCKLFFGLVFVFSSFTAKPCLAENKCWSRDFCSQTDFKLGFQARIIKDFSISRFLSEKFKAQVEIRDEDVSSDCEDFRARDGEFEMNIPESGSCSIQVKEFKVKLDVNPDTNSDGVIDDADLLSVLLNFGAPCFNHMPRQDSVINDQTLGAVVANFGKSGDCLIGDLNRDGDVNDADLVLVETNFGKINLCSSDINNDGQTESEDLRFVLACFGLESDKCKIYNSETCTLQLTFYLISSDDFDNSSGSQSSGSSGQSASLGNQSFNNSGLNTSGSVGSSGVSSDVSSQQPGDARNVTGTSGSTGSVGVVVGDPDAPAKCNEVDFRRNIKTLDHNSRLVRDASNAVLDFLIRTYPARRSVILRNDIEAARRNVNNSFAKNWRFIWNSLPPKTYQCGAGELPNSCEIVNYSAAYSSISENEMKMFLAVSRVVNRYSVWFRARPNDFVTVQRLLARVKRILERSGSFSNSLPLVVITCEK